MRQLTEKTTKQYAIAWLNYRDEYEGKAATPAELKGFNAGFEAGLSCQDKRIEALEAFIAGKITRDELEKVTK